MTSTTTPAPAVTDRNRGLTLIGLLLALLLGALDQTIVATAGPAIQKSLAIEPSLYVWLTTAYLVSSTVMVPIYGKLGDLYGRKPIMLFGLSVFLIASLACGLSGNALALILFRGAQGLGAGALFTTAFAIVADLYPPAERGRISGALGGVFGLSSVIGPLIGGFLTDTLSWHWVFFVNLPVGVIAAWFIATRTPWIRPNAERRPSIDAAGAAALVITVVPLLLALSFGKSTVAPGEVGFLWGSWQILGMFALAAAGVVAFVVIERRARDPLLDLSLFSNPTFALGNLAIFVLGAGFLSAIVFLPLFMVNVVGLSATNSGLTTTPLTFGLIAGAMLSGALVTRTGRYKPIMLAGIAVLAVGFAIMGLTLTPDSTQLEVTLKMIVVGLGLGPIVALFSLAVQNAVTPEQTGVATSAVSFFQQMGGTIGLAVLGTVFATHLGDGLRANVAAATATLPAEVRAQFTGGNAQGQSAGGFNAAAVKAQVSAGFKAQRDALGAALGAGDAAAARALLENPGTPAELRPVLEATAAGAAPEAARRAALDGVTAGLDRAERQTIAAVDRVDDGVKRAFTDAISTIYRIGILIVLAGFSLTALLPEVPLRRGEPGEHAEPAFAL